MLSSTSSSNQRLPSLPWLKILLPSLLLVTLFALLLEGRLALRGIASTLLDSETHWQEERARVKGLGKQALVIIGASRIQLGIDVPLLSKLSGMETVQLAIDGSSYGPVLLGLAQDTDFCGTVVIDYNEQSSLASDPASLATRYESGYQRKKVQLQSWNFDRLENRLEWFLHANLRSYADGARPLDSLLFRVLKNNQTGQYLRTATDRSRAADYSKVPMPGFYLSRVIRNLGKYAPPPNQNFDNAQQLLGELQQRIDTLHAEPVIHLPEKHALLKQTVAKIQQRGGRVIFLLMPASGLIREIEHRQYPKLLFWEPLRKAIPAGMIHFEEHISMSDFVCPDGSHLDYRDKARFTVAFAQEAGLIKPNLSTQQ